VYLRCAAAFRRFTLGNSWKEFLDGLMACMSLTIKSTSCAVMG
jgi:hypothetical protein